MIARLAYALIAAIMLGACGSNPFPSPTQRSDRTPAIWHTPTPTASPDEIATLPTPTALQPTPGGIQPTPTTATLDRHRLAEVIVPQVRHVANPEEPDDKAFQSPRHPFERAIQPLPRGSSVYLLESRVVEGREWWRVAENPYVGCCAPFGWIPATGRDGEPVIAPSDIACPGITPRVTSYDLVHPDTFEPPVCFGDREIVMRGYLACTRPTVDAAYFLSGLGSWDQTGIECQLDGRMTIYGEMVTSLAEGSSSEWSDFVDLRGQYYHPDAAQCRWTSGNFMQIPVDDAPIETAQFACQMRFVGTRVSALP